MPGVRAKRCQMLGPAPSAKGEPSTWWAEVEAPHRKSAGKRNASLIASLRQQAPAVEVRRRLDSVEGEEGRHHVPHVGAARGVELQAAEQDALDERRVDRAVVAAPDLGVRLDDRLADAA